MSYRIVCFVLWVFLYICPFYVANAQAPFSFGNPLIDAIESRNFEQARDIVEQGVPVDTRGKFGATALMRAALHGNVEMLKFLLEHGANPDTQDIGGATSLHIALREGHTEIVGALLNAHANPNLRDLGGLSALDYANNLQRSIELHLIRNYIQEEQFANSSAANVIGDLPWLAPGQEPINDDVIYVYMDKVDMTPTPKAESAPVAEVIASPLSADHTLAAPSLNAKTEVKPKKRKASGIAVAIPPSKTSSPPTEHKLVVQEAVKLPESFDISKEQLPATLFDVEVATVIHVEILGFANESEVMACNNMLQVRYPGKRYHNFYSKSGTKTHVTPFSNVITAQSWCDQLRLVNTGWKCIVHVPPN